METLYKLYCSIHKTAKKVLQRGGKPSFKMVNVTSNDLLTNQEVEVSGPYINDLKIDNTKQVAKKHVFPVENIVASNSNSHLKESYQQNKNLRIPLGVSAQDAVSTWESFIKASVIPDGYRNSGLHYTGYILDSINDWCLPTWIWTNAALVRLYCHLDQTSDALKIGDLLLEQQLECGGWIVRNDYTSEGAVPTLAPNDSAYLANNACLELYKKTNKSEYLEAAKKCADWIIESARPDGLVWSGYDMKREKWVKNHIIVDTGFTGGLFANLYEVTGEKKYKDFLEKFINRFIELFFDASKSGFATSLDINNKHVGGFFARGQAWALEGLIPAYRVFKTEKIQKVINATIDNLINQQLKNGGWSYNFAKPLLGIDCKGVAVIAKSLMEWHKIEPKDQILNSAKKALQWSRKHTAVEGECKGGIFSFCMEGAVVHNFYTKTAFVYTSAYAIELHRALEI